MTLPLWSLFPFVGVVASFAFFPSVMPRFWRKHHKFILSIFSVPVIAVTGAMHFDWLVKGFADYVSFICLLGALFTIGGGLYFHGTPKANPITNFRYMIVGASFAGFLGTLATSMILIRPLLRSNRGRKHDVHVVVFFIFIVSNVGGLLTPLGNPPLFMGYLAGVPFWWTLKLIPIWLFTVTVLAGLFLALDTYFYIHDPDFRGPLKQDIKSPLRIVGRRNFLLIPFIFIALICPSWFARPYILWATALQVFLLLFVIYLSHKVTPHQVHVMNRFSWAPFKEVAFIFAAIFATLVPAVKYLEANAQEMGVSTAWNLFWSSGLLSGILDNAPTYAAFFAVIQGLGKDFASVTLSTGKIISEPLLVALSCGSVFFGGLTYIGNAPNLLVKSVAEEDGLHMPSFFPFLTWSIGFLLPVLFLVGIVFFK